MSSVLFVFSTLLVTASNGVRSTFCQFSNCPRAWATAIHCKQTFNTYQSQSQSYITTDSQSASLSWCQVLIWTDSCGFVDVGRPLWREVGSFQFLLGVVSATIFRSESHWTHWHIVLSLLLGLTQLVKVKVTLRPIISPSWCQAPIWDPRPIFLSPWYFILDSCILHPTWRARSLYLFPQEQGSPVIPPGHSVCLINLHIIMWYICS
jgi:hypothetical protein